MSRLFAPAKLTVSLRVRGVRPDGYHELDAEMVTLSLADELIFDEGGTGLVVVSDRGTRCNGSRSERRTSWPGRSTPADAGRRSV